MVTVAVKTLKSRKEDDRVRFFQEAAIVGQFYHQNVVALHGIILPTSVITEDVISNIYSVGIEYIYL